MPWKSKDKKLNITGLFARSRRKSSEYFTSNLIYCRWQVWSMCCAFFFGGVVIAALSIGMIGWTLYDNMNSTTSNNAGVQNVSGKRAIDTPMITISLPTATPQPTTEPLQMSGKFWFDIYGMTDDGLVGRLTVTENESYDCTCQGID